MSIFEPYADFGPMVVESDVDDAVTMTLKLYLPTYLREVQRERSGQLKGREFELPKADAYRTVLDDEEFPDKGLPAIIVTTAPTVGEPEMNGDGFYYAAWSVIVSAVVRGRSSSEARRVASLFAGSIRRILTHQPDLGGFAGGVRWTSGQVMPVRDGTNANGRHLAAGTSTFSVYVDNVLREGVGPAVPGDDFEDLPEVTQVDTVIQERT
jgi:hypothetical protein